MSEQDRIVRVAARGDGVTADGRHAALAAPGDWLRADGSVEPGPNRQTPPCRHFPTCGGCQLQHLGDAAYADFVRDRVIGGLAAQGLDTAVRPAIVSPPRTRRRATFHAEKLGKLVIGFSEQGSHALVDLSECHILDPRLFALVAPLRRLLPPLMRPKRRVEIVMTLADQGVDLLLRGVEADGLAAAEALSAFGQAQGLARLSIDGGLGVETRYEPVEATVTLGGLAVPLPPGAFLQATPEGEAALVAAVREAVGGATTVADLFAGLGTFALALSGKVYAAEGARDAFFALKAAAGRAQRQVFAEHRDLFRRPLMPAELDRFAAIVLDPPRAGAREQAEQLAASKAPVIAYVSCNPSSFARDAKTICEGGYRLDWVQPVGQFRWSTHVELVGRFSR
ncbi:MULTISPECIES: class I SAM-dependent RNA methyltransferase [Sphingomonas]|uniref:class I SAM-dependent RNA methyltransferase n=1 Tax=Sphingomonas TaxID=13687 RepID=UPI00083684A7|nr:class I SAM-dependent RNA methyltransferase [Sphingomonas sp. CCH10-B3]